MMTNVQAEFYQASVGKLFRLIRSPQNIRAHILYIAPLFEQANQTRHMHTRLALSAYQVGVQSIIFDHYGSGDSGSVLSQTNLAIWQQDIILQINALKQESDKPVYLSCLLSAALLLNENILSIIDGLLLAQPEFNGKRFVQQFKRLALASQLITNKVRLQSEAEIEIAGYVMQPTLLNELSQQDINQFDKVDKPCFWLEWHTSAELPLARAKQQQLFSSKNNQLITSVTQQEKFWQSTELTLATAMLIFEQHALLNLLKAESHEQGGQ